MLEGQELQEITLEALKDPLVIIEHVMEQLIESRMDNDIQNEILPQEDLGHG